MSHYLKGRLVQWDSKKGFGFIKPRLGTENIFIHISDFKDTNFHPQIEEIIVYKIGEGREGKKRAINAYSERYKLKHIGNIDSYGPKKYTKRKFFKRSFVPIVFIGIIILFGGLFKRHNQEKDNTLSIVNHQEITYKDQTDTEDLEAFLKKQDEFIAAHTLKSVKHSSEKDRNLCDGREYCSQMKSCDEAKYFLNHCPNTKMDGDGDGIPCERQLCGH